MPLRVSEALTCMSQSDDSNRGMSPREALEQTDELYRSRYSRNVHIHRECPSINKGDTREIKTVSSVGQIPLQVSLCEFCRQKYRTGSFTT